MLKFIPPVKSGTGLPRNTRSSGVILPSPLTSSNLKRPGAAPSWVACLATSSAFLNRPKVLNPKKEESGWPTALRIGWIPRNDGLIEVMKLNPGERATISFFNIEPVRVKSYVKSDVNLPLVDTKRSRPLLAISPMFTAGGEALLPAVNGIGTVNNKSLVSFLHQSKITSKRPLKKVPSKPTF